MSVSTWRRIISTSRAAGRAHPSRRRIRPPGSRTSSSALVARRRQLVEMLSAEENRFRSAAQSVRETVEQHVVYLRRLLEETDDDMSRFVRESE